MDATAACRDTDPCSMLLSALLGEEFKYACCPDHVRPVHVPESAHDDPQVGRDGRRIPALLPLQPLPSTSALTTMFAVIGSSNLDIRSLSLHGAIRPRPRSHVHSRHASR